MKDESSEQGKKEAEGESDGRFVLVTVTSKFPFEPEHHVGLTDEAVLAFYAGSEGLEIVLSMDDDEFNQTAEFVEGDTEDGGSVINIMLAALQLAEARLHADDDSGGAIEARSAVEDAIAKAEEHIRCRIAVEQEDA